MREGDTSRRRRLSGTRQRWYAEHRATRFALRMLGERPTISDVATITIDRIRHRSVEINLKHPDLLAHL
jgi:hypothetical protein